MSTFVTLLHRDLSSKAALPPSPSRAGSPAPSSAAKDALRSYFLELNPPLSIPDAEGCIDMLQKLEASGAFSGPTYGEEETLRTGILSKLWIGLYVQTLETYLREASDAENELEWWSDVERSRASSAYYLLQSE
jgi:nuclear control of ATPase protein 2